MKTIVITGSTRGIGYGLAEQFLKKGHNVIINGTTEEGVNNAIQKLSFTSGNLIGIVANISEKDSPEKIYTAAVAKFNTIDIWINNAGVSNEYKQTYNQCFEEIKKVFDINIMGLVNATIYIYNKFNEQGYGKIFNMEGLGSNGRTIPKMAVYGTSKRAVNYFNKAFAKEIKNSNIQLGTISPGMVITDLLKNSINQGTIEEINQSKRIFNMLGEKVTVVTDFLAKKILQCNKNYCRINYMSTGKLIKRLLFNNFKPRDFFKESE